MIKSFTIKKSVIQVCFGLILYFIVMQLYYVSFIGTEYERFRFVLEFNAAHCIEAILVFIIILIFLISISRQNDFYYVVYLFFIILFFVPAIILHSYSSKAVGPFYCTVGLLVSMGIVPHFKMKPIGMQAKKLSNAVLFGMAIAACLPIMFKFGFYLDIDNFILQNVYTTREHFAERSSPIYDYLFNWLVKAIIPFFIIYFLIKKKWLLATTVLLVLLYLYVISGNKLIYITSFTILFFYFFGKDYYTKATYFIFALLGTLIAIPLVDNFLLQSNTLKGIFVMRMLFLPSQLNYNYFDFFEGRPLYFSESSFFKNLIDYPFDRPVGFIISETYFNTSDMNANNGFISDGYMNLGYPGVVLNIAIICSLFFFFKNNDLDSRYLGVFCLMVFLFLSAPILSMFVTSGLWLIIIFSFSLMKRRPANLEPNHISE